MLEVVSACIGVGIYGTLKGFTQVKTVAKPVRLLTGHALICAACLLEVKRRIEVDKERMHLWPSIYRTSLYINDAIDSGSPKYLLANLPLLIAVYSGSLSIVGSLALILRR